MIVKSLWVFSLEYCEIRVEYLLEIWQTEEMLGGSCRAYRTHLFRHSRRIPRQGFWNNLKSKRKPIENDRELTWSLCESGSVFQNRLPRWANAGISFEWGDMTQWALGGRWTLSPLQARCLWYSQFICILVYFFMCLSCDQHVLNIYLGLGRVLGDLLQQKESIVSVMNVTNYTTRAAQETINLHILFKNRMKSTTVNANAPPRWRIYAAGSSGHHRCHCTSRPLPRWKARRAYDALQNPITLKLRE